jgi:rhodanese-related sulfurtransferase
MSAFQGRVGELPSDRPVMVVCKTGVRSAAVTAFLLRAGRSDVVNVRGGMDAWQRSGLPTRSGPPEPGEGDLPG